MPVLTCHQSSLKRAAMMGFATPVNHLDSRHQQGSGTKANTREEIKVKQLWQLDEHESEF